MPGLALDSMPVRPDMDRHQPSSPPLTRPPSVHSPRQARPTTPMSPSAAASPMTTSTKRFSFYSLSSQQKTIKYGRGRHANVELVPQPSDDDDDPLNWPRWRKHLNLASLLVTVALVAALKTVFVTTGAAMAAHYRVSFTAVAALTAVPLMLSSATGLASSVAAKFWGKRPVYLASMLLLFVGSVWNATAADSYASCMGARAVQGLGWGAFDTLVAASIQDTYYEHERDLPASLHKALGIAATWASPLLGGLASANAGSFTVQFRIINSLYLVAIPLLALGAPETAFDRSLVPSTPSPVGFGGSPPWRPWRLRHWANKEVAARYLGDMARLAYRTPLTRPAALQAPRALVAPTTLVLFLLSAVPLGALWGLALSLAHMAGPAPLALSPAKLGPLMLAPWILPTAVVCGLALHRRLCQKQGDRANYVIVAAATAVTLAGLLTFGLELDKLMAPASPGPGLAATLFTPEAASQINLALVSFQVGALACGFHAVDAIAQPVLARSASFTSSSIVVAQRGIADMQSGLAVLRSLAAGVFVLAMPSALAHVKAAVIGLAVAHFVVAAAAASLWRFFDEAVWRADGNVMGLFDLGLLKQSVSFFDHE